MNTSQAPRITDALLDYLEGAFPASEFMECAHPNDFARVQGKRQVLDHLRYVKAIQDKEDLTNVSTST